MALDPIYPEDFGALADANGPNGGATDNGPPILAALQKGLPSGSPVVLGKSGQHYGIKTLVPWHNGVSQALTSVDLIDRGPLDSSRGVWCWWTGAPGGKMFELYGAQCKVSGLGFGASVGTSLSMFFDVDFPAALNLGYPNLSTEHDFEDCHFTGGYGSGGAQSPNVTDAIVVGASNPDNNEDHDFLQCRFTRLAGTAVVCHQGNGQAKNWKVSRCVFAFNGGAFAAPYGSCSPLFDGCNFLGQTKALYWGNGSYEPIRVVGCDSELCVQFADAWGVHDLTIEDCRLAPNAAPTARPPFRQEWVVGGNRTRIADCQFDSPQNGFYVRATDDGLLIYDFDFYGPYLPVAIDSPPRFSVEVLGGSYWTGTKLVPQGLWRQDNIRVQGDAGPASALAPLTVPPPGGS